MNVHTRQNLSISSLSPSATMSVVSSSSDVVIFTRNCEQRRVVVDTDEDGLGLRLLTRSQHS